LERAGLISKAGRAHRRKLASWANIRIAAAQLNERQKAVLARVQKPEEPIAGAKDRDYQVAYRLADIGLLEHTNDRAAGRLFKATKPEPDWIWLPNTLVDGLGDPLDTPLSRLRQAQDGKTAMLLLDCYRTGNLAENGGIHWRKTRRLWKRVKVGEQGPYTIWGFAGPVSTAWQDFAQRFMTGKTTEDAEGKKTDSGWTDFWSAWKALEQANLIEHVAHIIEADTNDAQPIHPYCNSTYAGEAIERELAEIAHAVGRGMVTDGQFKWASEELGTAPWLCPVPSHIVNVQLVDIARPKHRPDTKKTAAWVANFLHEATRFKAVFAAMTEKAA
jgi:hypothetical protein